MLRRHLVGREQSWEFTPPAAGWQPPRIESTSLYLHVPFCRHFCPYCPYNKVRYAENLLEPYTAAALAEVEWWADRIGAAEITSVYIGGGTPTLALDSVRRILERIRQRFNVTGDIGIETNPSDMDEETIRQLHAVGVTLVSLGVQSFHPKHLATLARGYQPSVAENALKLLTNGRFVSVNADIMFALPGETTADVIADLEHAAELGANQLTTYPLFTFPYTSVGEYLRLKAVRMPNLRARRTQYKAIHNWCAENGFERVSVWGFRRGDIPRYSSVTRESYIGIGPGAGSYLPDGFVLNTFDLKDWMETATSGKSVIALRLPFTEDMAGWWWLYWRLYDTRIPTDPFGIVLGKNAIKARRWLTAVERVGWVNHDNNRWKLTEPGAFWLHLAQNHFALNYVNTLWTAARCTAWPERVAI